MRAPLIAVWVVVSCASVVGQNMRVIWSHAAGALGNQAGGLNPDGQGNFWVVGLTNSATFPVTPDALQPKLGGRLCGAVNYHSPPPIPCSHIFIQKLSPAGAVIYSSYLGGSGDDSPLASASDAAGNLYILVGNRSNDFPGLLPPQPYGALLVKVSASGRLAVVKLFPNADASALALDSAGRVYLCGGGYGNSNFAPGVSFNPNGAGSITLFRLTPDLATIDWAVKFGSSSRDTPTAVAVDSLNYVYVSGVTRSGDFPVTPGAFQAAYQATNPPAGGHGFISKIDPVASKFVYSTFIASDRQDQISGIAVDPVGNVYVVGITDGLNFPTTPGALSRNGEQSAFVTKLNPAGSAAVYSTLLPETISVNAVAVNALGIACVTGRTGSTAFPVVGPVQASNRGFDDAFVSCLRQDGSGLTFSTYLGGNNEDSGTQIAFAGSGIVVRGEASSSNFPLTEPGVDAYKTAFVTYLDTVSNLSPQLFSRSMVNAASYVTTNFNIDPDLTIAPGELVTIFGTGIGPVTPASLTLGANGRVSTSLSGTTVMFDELTAPVIYTSSTQLNAIVPYGVAGRQKVQVRVGYGGLQSNALSAVVAPSMPGIFALGNWGIGSTAALNQDGSVNSMDNPARLGDVVTFYVTGAGLLTPTPLDGEVSMAPLARVAYPVTVQIGGIDAQVLYAGAAPGLVSGVVQVNVLVASANGIGARDGVEVSITIGGFQTGNTPSLFIR